MSVTVKEEMQQLGASLKRARESQQISLAEVEAVISVRSSFLSYIEEGLLHKLISPIYALGFLKQYASFLNIDGDQLLQDYPRVLRVLTESQHSDTTNLGIGTFEMRGSPGKDIKWLPNLLWIAGSSIIISVIWYLFKLGTVHIK